ncbi:protein of unknown function [Magnetospirillum gryphiswaldense MSR-1 v2]|uniref:Uncharacterized protein n=1 Tax=Magnetospirillum gryphiswaldense (strain DSM 6361 / JCM 21280 / NBRC 15271 / MSR-1) TaxID=431944 RepID=V6F3P9_MAGGM|nr:protein of unknown function [Magnetospirillum gryphiswaldense MSR-1 v2]
MSSMLLSGYPTAITYMGTAKGIDSVGGFKVERLEGGIEVGRHSALGYKSPCRFEAEAA